MHVSTCVHNSVITYYLLITFWLSLQWYLRAIALCDYQNNHNNGRSSAEKALMIESESSWNDAWWPEVLCWLCQEKILYHGAIEGGGNMTSSWQDDQGEYLPPLQAQWWAVWEGNQLVLEQVAGEHILRTELVLYRGLQIHVPLQEKHRRHQGNLSLKGGRFCSFPLGLIVALLSLPCSWAHFIFHTSLWEALTWGKVN